MGIEFSQELRATGVVPRLEFDSADLELPKLKLGELPTEEGSIITVKYLDANHIVDNFDVITADGSLSCMEVPFMLSGAKWEVCTSEFNPEGQPEEFAISKNESRTLALSPKHWGSVWLPFSFKVYSEGEDNTANIA